MKISTAALLFLILAAALGPSAHGSDGSGSLSQTHELGFAIHALNRSMILYSEKHHPTDCCFSYTPRNIRCVFMEDYYETSSACSLPAVIFLTKRGQEVCADPHNKRVQVCIKKLDSAKKRGKQLVEEKEY